MKTAEINPAGVKQDIPPGFWIIKTKSQFLVIQLSMTPIQTAEVNPAATKSSVSFVDRGQPPYRGGKYVGATGLHKISMGAP